MHERKSERIVRKKLSAFLVLEKHVHFRSAESWGYRGTLRGSSEVIHQAEEFLLQHLCAWTEGLVKASLANHSNSESLLVAHASLSQDVC